MSYYSTLHCHLLSFSRLIKTSALAVWIARLWKILLCIKYSIKYTLWRAHWEWTTHYLTCRIWGTGQLLLVKRSHNFSFQWQSVLREDWKRWMVLITCKVAACSWQKCDMKRSASHKWEKMTKEVGSRKCMEQIRTDSWSFQVCVFLWRTTRNRLASWTVAAHHFAFGFSAIL